MRTFFIKLSIFLTEKFLFKFNCVILHMPIAYKVEI